MKKKTENKRWKKFFSITVFKAIKHVWKEQKKERDEERDGEREREMKREMERERERETIIRHFQSKIGRASCRERVSSPV